MFKVTALALVVALINADGASRRLLQTGAPVVEPAPIEPAVIEPATPAEPATPGVEPATPATPAEPATPVQQPQPPVTVQQPPAQQYQPPAQQYRPQPQPQYNPFQQMYCNPMSPQYDLQDCMQYGGAYGGYQQQYGVPQQYGQQYNPFGAAPAGINMNNPYCNYMSPMYDLQDCYQYSHMFQQAPPAQYGQSPAAPRPATPGQPQAPGQGGFQQPNPMNPFCNPYSGMYDAQDCMRSMNPQYAAWI